MKKEILNNYQGRNILYTLYIIYRFAIHSAFCTYFTLLLILPAFLILPSLLVSCSKNNIENICTENTEDSDKDGNINNNGDNGDNEDNGDKDDECTITFTINIKAPTSYSKLTSSKNNYCITPTQSYVNNYQIEFIDVFIYNNDKSHRLDSYQRFVAEELPFVRIGAREGNKIAVIIANAPESLYNENNVSSLESIMNLRTDFISENNKYPIMSAVKPIKTKINKVYNILLNPLLSKIKINSIKCDFRNKLYEGAVMQNVKFYLININRECEILKDSTYTLTNILNQGSFDKNNFISMNNPELIYKGFKEEIGSERCYPNINLYTYPNDTKQEDLGSPYTRLVIECDINDNKYYYPININQGNFSNHTNFNRTAQKENKIGCGIKRNMIYEYDITITKLGTTDPDKAVEPDMVEINNVVKPWEEEDREIIEFTLHKTFMRENQKSHKYTIKKLNNTCFLQTSTNSIKPDEILVSDLNLFIINPHNQIDEHKFITKEHLYQDDTVVKFTTRLLKNCNYNIYVCANFGFPLYNIKTFNDLKSYRYYLSYPDEFKTGIPMTGVAYNVNVDEPANNTFNKIHANSTQNNNSIKGKKKVNIDLIRLMSKISFDIDRSKLDKDVKLLIRKLRIGGCPKSALLFEDSKARGPKDIFHIGFNLGYDETNILNFVEEEGRSESVAMYMLENMQGTNTEDTFKTHSFIEIQTEYFSEKYTTPPGEFVTYRFYLENSNNSRDIKRNRHYHYTFRPLGQALNDTSSWAIERPK